MAADSTPVWLEPVRGSYPDPRLFGLTGLGQLRAYLERLAPRPPISHLIGTYFVEVGEGTATFTMPASPWMLASQGHLAAGSLMILADAPLGCAVHSALPSATPYTTAELSMSFLRPIAADGSEMKAVGHLIHAGDKLALSSVAVEDGNGRLVAHGTSTCFVFDAVEGIDPPEGLPLLEQPTYPSPDPYLRPPRGEVIPWEVWREMSGLEILRQQILGELPAPPIHHLTGLTPIDVSEGKATFTMPATEWLNSPLGLLQGGAIGLLGHSALATAVVSTLPAGAAYSPVDVKVNFLRPVASDGRELTAHGVVTHRGRTLALATADVVGADGRKVATATGSTIILPERPDPS